MRKPKTMALYALLTIAAWGFATPLFACKVYVDFSARVPFNAVQIENTDRVKLADAVVRARTWPDVEIGANISAPAFATESDPRGLSEARARSIKTYLMQLGLDERNISYEPIVVAKPVAKDKEGLEPLREIYVEIVPVCRGSCEALCANPGWMRAPQQ
jgi:hypothetical protein